MRGAFARESVAQGPVTNQRETVFIWSRKTGESIAMRSSGRNVAQLTYALG
jgi:glycerol kinase